MELQDMVTEIVVAAVALVGMIAALWARYFRKGKPDAEPEKGEGCED